MFSGSNERNLKIKTVQTIECVLWALYYTTARHVVSSLANLVSLSKDHVA